MIAAALTASSAIPVARADPSAAYDPWFGRDKALHFTASAVIAGGGYGASTLFTDDIAARIVFGAGLAIGAGIVKEGLDAAGLGTPSLRDFTWDLIGAAAGVGIAVTIDLALGGPPKPVRAR